jgi:hypothetical protein
MSKQGGTCNIIEDVLIFIDGFKIAGLPIESIQRSRIMLNAY